MLETDIHSQIQQAAREFGLFWQRLEVPAALGIPDGFLSGAGEHVWVEAKVIPDWPGPERIEYRQGQLAWALRAADLGERVVTFVGCPDGYWRLFDQGRTARAISFESDHPMPHFTTAEFSRALERCLRWRDV